VAAMATSRLKLATGVVNPVVRHPAVLASAIGGVAELAGDRVVLGLGRGDSSVRVLGLPEASVAGFESAVADLQIFLAGGHVGGPGGPHVPWLVARPGTKVPLDVAATGPRVIAIAGRLAERTTLALGAETTRLSWGIDEVRRAAGGRPRLVGAAIPIGVGNDMADARRMASGPLSVTARFAAGAVGRGAPLSNADAALVRSVDENYESAGHGRAGSVQARLLSDDFVDRFAVVGSPQRCAERIRALGELGLHRLVFMVGSEDGSPAGHVAQQAMIADRVLSLVK
jgi:5,10-methylenetetrahydromethanopterin reductase